MQEADIGIEPDALERGGAVAAEQAVRERQQRVDVIQRRTAAALVKEEIGLVLQDHVVENVKVRLGAGAFFAAQGVKRRLLRDERIEPLDLADGGLQALRVYAQGVVALCAFDAPAGVVQLAEDHAARDAAALRRVVGHAVLHPAQEHIPVFLAAGAGEEAAAGRAERQTDAALCAPAHERRGGPGIAEADDPIERVQREAADLVPVTADDNIFPVEAQVGVLRGDKQGVEQLFHGVSSMLARR